MPKNLIKNGAFEVSTLGWLSPSAMTIGSADVIEGARNMQQVAPIVTGGSNYTSFANSNTPEIVRLYGIPVVAGVTYTWSYRHFYSLAATSAATEPRVDWFDANGTYISTSLSGLSFSQQPDWSSYPTYSVTAPAGAAYASPGWNRNGHNTGTSKYDACQFEIGSARTAYERHPAEPFRGSSAPDYGYVFRQFPFGTGTYFIVETQEGLFSTPPVRDASVDNASDHGAFPGVMLYGKRIITFTLKVTGTYGDDIQTKLLILKDKFAAPRVRTSTVEEALYFKRPGQVVKIINVRVTKCSIPSNYATARGLVEASVELQATDPRIYSLATSTATISNGAGVSSASKSTAMLGDHDDGASPTLVISGPSTNPVVANYTDGARAIRLQIVLTAGQSVRVNMKTKKVEKDVGAGYVEDYSILRADSQWWRLLPGVNDLAYSRDVGNVALQSDCVLTWQDTWN